MSSVNDLIKAIANRDFEPEFIDSDIQFINERFDSFRKYFNAVYEHVYGGSTALTLVHGGMMSTEKYQDYVMNLDKNRKIMHDRAIDSCAQLNRQCDMYGIEHLCPEVEFDPINNEKCVNRGEIADFVGRYVYSVFQQGREGRTMDQLIIDNEMKYGDRPLSMFRMSLQRMQVEIQNTHTIQATWIKTHTKSSNTKMELPMTMLVGILWKTSNMMTMILGNYDEFPQF